MPYGRGHVELTLAAAVLGALLLLFTPAIADPDLWGHVRFGQDFWRTGQAARADVYSYLSGEQPWINHEWLAEAVYAAAFDGAGARGLTTLNAGLALSTMALLYAHLRRRRVAAFWAWLVLAFYALLLRPGVLNIRPQAFSYLCFALVLILITNTAGGGPRRLWWAVPLVALWANLHGGVLAGLGMLLLWAALHAAAPAIGAIVARLRPGAAIAGPLDPNLPASSCPSWTGLAVLPACALAVCLNPWGPALPAFLLRTATVPRPEILDWQPIELASTWGGLYVVGLAFVLAGVHFTRRSRDFELLALLACIAVLPLASSRHLQLFAVAAVVLAGEHLADTAARLPAALLRLVRRAAGTALAEGAGTRASARLSGLRERGLAIHGRDERRALPLAAAVLPSLLLVLAAALFLLELPRLAAIPMFPKPIAYPAGAVAVLKQSGVTGNMATEFNWGEYVLWYVGPGIKVSIDGRRETVYSDAVYRENLNFMHGGEGWDALVERPETGLALVDRTRPVFALMAAKPGWALVYDDPAAAIYARAGTEAAARIKAASPPAVRYDGAGLAFP